MSDTPTPTIQGTVKAWLPTTPPRPAPELLNFDDALTLFRLKGETGKRTLQRYQYNGNLKSIRIGKNTMFRLDDCLAFIRDKEGMR